MKRIISYFVIYSKGSKKKERKKVCAKTFEITLYQITAHVIKAHCSEAPEEVLPQI